MSLFSASRKHARKRLLQGLPGSETSELWRGHYFMEALLYLVWLGPFLLIPSLIISLQAGFYGLVGFSLFAYAIVLLLLLAPGPKLLFRKTCLLATLYLLGLILFYFLGWSGPALVYLLGISLLAALLVSARAGYFTLFINALVVMGFVLYAGSDTPTNTLLTVMNSASMLTVSLNLLLLNFILLVTINSLFVGLQKKVNTEQRIRKKLSQEITLHQAARRKAEENAELKTTFLANVSHEIRTPMNGILGFTDILINMHPSEEEQIQFLQIIKKSGQDLLSIINELMDISRIESGEAKPVMQAVHVPDLIQSLTTLLTPSAEKKGLSLQVTNLLRPDQHLIVSDQEKLRAILINLMTNAIKYSDSGSVKVSYKVLRSTLYCAVEDEGPGIPKQQQELVFNRFFRVPATQNKPKEGTGLGLSIAKSYAELMGGKITLWSEPGKGSTFTLCLPYVKARK